MGRLVADPQRRTDPSGKPFTPRIAAATDDGDVLVSLIAFSGISEALAGLAKGDTVSVTVSVTGRAKPTAWMKDEEVKAGLSL